MAQDIRVEAGKSYKINGYRFKVVEETPIGEGCARYIRQRATVRGVRGAVRQLEVRHNGSAFWCGLTSYKVEEITHFEPLAENVAQGRSNGRRGLYRYR